MRIHSTYLAVLALAVGATIALPSAQASPAASSTSTTKYDADDLDEPLDISDATLSVKDKDVKVEVGVYEPIDPDVLYDNNLILVQFKTGANTARTIYFNVGGPKLSTQVCTVYLDGTKSGDHCSKLTAPSKPDAASVAVRIPRKKIAAGMTTYKWRVLSYPYSAGCQSTVTCVDHAPDNEGWFTWKTE